MLEGLIHLLIGLAVLLICWWVAERFSPDPLITKIIQVVIFIIAIILILTLVFPMIGVHI